jgi:hypothetical protein
VLTGGYLQHSSYKLAEQHFGLLQIWQKVGGREENLSARLSVRAGRLRQHTNGLPNAIVRWPNLPFVAICRRRPVSAVSALNYQLSAKFLISAAVAHSDPG